MRHDNHADMNHLSAAVLKVPADQKLRFAANVLGHHLMIGPWWLRGIHRAVTWTRGWQDTMTWWLLLDRMNKRGVNLADHVISGFSHHIYHGKDFSDARSVGGLNQKEVETTLLILAATKASGASAIRNMGGGALNDPPACGNIQNPSEAGHGSDQEA